MGEMTRQLPLIAWTGDPVSYNPKTEIISIPCRDADGRDCALRVTKPVAVSLIGNFVALARLTKYELPAGLRDELADMLAAAKQSH